MLQTYNSKKQKAQTNWSYENPHAEDFAQFPSLAARLCPAKKIFETTQNTGDTPGPKSRTSNKLLYLAISNPYCIFRLLIYFHKTPNYGKLICRSTH